MNNSFIALETSLEVDNINPLREKEAELVKIIEALNEVGQSSSWISLKSLVFDKLTESLEKRLRQEVDRDEIILSEVQFLKGQIRWAKKYSDLSKLVSEFRLELSNIRKLIPPTER